MSNSEHLTNVCQIVAAYSEIVAAYLVQNDILHEDVSDFIPQLSPHSV
jgi:predicted transcriptional regulator